MATRCGSLLKLNASRSTLYPMTLICPECKNDVDLARYPNLAKEQVIECNHCGITLLVTDIQGGSVKTEIVDEAK